VTLTFCGLGLPGNLFSETFKDCSVAERTEPQPASGNYEVECPDEHVHHAGIPSKEFLPLGKEFSRKIYFHQNQNFHGNVQVSVFLIQCSYAFSYTRQFPFDNSKTVSKIKPFSFDLTMF